MTKKSSPATKLRKAVNALSSEKAVEEITNTDNSDNRELRSPQNTVSKPSNSPVQRSKDTGLRPHRPAERKLLNERSNQVDQSTVVVVPTLNTLMSDALSIIGAELTHYRSKTKRGVTLDLKEARVIANYMDTLTRASKESREQARAEDLSELSNEELLQLATSLAKNSHALEAPSPDDNTDKADEENN